MKVLTPALSRWHRELAGGERRTTTFDALWQAACAEASARDAAAQGFDQSALQDLDRAAAILREAGVEL